MCRKPSEIRFAPLNKEQEYTGAELMDLYDVRFSPTQLTRQQDRNLGKFLHIIRNAPEYPIIYCKEEQVLSLPPIINSQRECSTNAADIRHQNRRRPHPKHLH